MSFNRASFKEVCNRSGFNKKELATIYGVTRQTIYDWQRDSAPTQLALAQRAEKATEALSKAIQSKVLPFPENLAERSRQARISIIVTNIMESLKPKGR